MHKLPFKPRQVYVHGEKLRFGDLRHATNELLHNRVAPMQRIVGYLYEHDREGLDIVVEVMTAVLKVPRSVVWDDLRTLVLQ